MNIASVTKLGKRKKQQDSNAHLIIGDVVVLVVADGNGEGGRLVSASAAKAAVSIAAYELSRKKNRKINHESQLRRIGLCVIKKAAKETKKAKQKHSVSDGATTLTLVLITSRFVGAFWVGDSQAILIEEEKVIRMTSPVHTLPELLIKTGLCGESIRLQKGLNCILTRSLGSDEDKPDHKVHPLCLPATILVGSDGVLTNLSDEEIKKEVEKEDLTIKGNVKGLTSRLVKKALRQGDGDNCTLITAHIPKKEVEK